MYWTTCSNFFTISFCHKTFVHFVSLLYEKITIMLCCGSSMFLGKITFCKHFLKALQNGRAQFVINGNWKINIPGEYNVAGTKLLYRRSADTWESFEVPGPTQEDLHIMVSFSS